MAGLETALYVALVLLAGVVLFAGFYGWTSALIANALHDLALADQPSAEDEGKPVKGKVL